MSIAVKALLQRGPSAPEPPDEAVERLISRGPDMGMEPEQEERERAATLAKAVETVCMYVCMVITYSRVWVNRVRLPILLAVS